MPKAGKRSRSDLPRILVCGWAGAGNIGDDLLTDWVVDRIEAAGGRALLTTRSFADTRRRHPSVTPVGWRLRDLALVLRGVDGICVGPGGIAQDSSSIWSLPGHLAKPVVGRLRHLPVAGIGLGADQLRRRSSRWLMRRALGDAIGVVVRDEPSAAALADAGVEAEVAADLVFDLNRLATDQRPVGRDHMVVAIGPAVRPGRIMPVARRHDHRDLEPAADAIGALSQRLACPVAVAAFRGGPDIDFGLQLVERLGDTARLVPDDPVAIRVAIAGARVVVSSRYHAAVMALVEATPVLVHSEEAKLVNLAQEIGDRDRIRTVPSWSDLVGADVVGPFDTGVGPVGVERHRQVLTALVEAAARRRG